MKKTLESVKLFGEISGSIWQPGYTCTKEFDVTFTPNDRPFSRKWTGIRDALLYITNDGDFQSCRVSYCVMKVTYRSGNRTETITNEVDSSWKIVSDLFE